MEWWEVELIDSLREKGNMLKIMRECCDEELAESYNRLCNRIEYLEECTMRGYDVSSFVIQIKENTMQTEAQRKEWLMEVIKQYVKMYEDVQNMLQIFKTDTKEWNELSFLGNDISQQLNAFKNELKQLERRKGE